MDQVIAGKLKKHRLLLIGAYVLSILIMLFSDVRLPMVKYAVVPSLRSGLPSIFLFHLVMLSWNSRFFIRVYS